MMDAALMSKIPENIMKPHDPDDDPFAGLADDSNQLTSPLEYGSGISYLVPSSDRQQSKKEQEKAIAEGGEAKEGQHGSSAESTGNHGTAAASEVKTEE